MEAHFLVDYVTELFTDATEFVSREFIPATHVRLAQNFGSEENWITMGAATASQRNSVCGERSLKKAKLN